MDFVMFFDGKLEKNDDTMAPPPSSVIFSKHAINKKPYFWHKPENSSLKNERA